MAKAKIPVEFDPVITTKVDAALARIQSKAKGVDFGGGARSLDKLSRPLGKITGQATEFQKSLEASNARVLAFGASVAVINKLSQAFSALVSNTIKVEATFAKINTILGGTDKQLRQFGDGIFKVAQKTATSFDQVSEGALELARQGLSVEESLSRVETALKLVRVAGVSSEQAVSGLTAAIKGFEGAGLTVAAIGDKLSEVDTKFAVSTEDLINGLERASASARVAGVSFDELLAVVTTVQERTQRGGAVIGNAFKTIFARLGRTDTLSALEELGINVLDTQGNVRSAIPLFQELAGELNKLGLKSVEAGDIIQKVAGVRQRDILISLVEDLNSSQSQFSKALQTSATAAGALDSKNNSLNQTLEALINNLTIGGQKLASILGELGFTDSVKDILKVFSSVVNGLSNLLQGDSLGAKFAQGIVKGIGGVLTGPGFALIGAIFIKLFLDLAKFGASSLASLLGINKAAQQQAALQQSVLQTLFQNENIQREILALEGNKVAQEQLLLKIYNQQAAALARVQKAAAVVTPALFGAGLRGGSSGVKPKGQAAGGYIASESRDISRGVGGAPSNAKVVSIPNFAFGGGKRGTMVANTSEYVVPNYAGGGDAIFNKDMVKTMGLPSGAKKINAADGFIPNFAAKRPQSLERLRGLVKSGGEKGAKAKAELVKREKAKKNQSAKVINLNAQKYSYLVPEFNFKAFTRESNPFALKGSKKGTQYKLTNLAVRGPKIPGGVEEAGNPEDKFLENNIRKSLVDQSAKYGNLLSSQVGGGKLSQSNLVRDFKSGGTRGAFGALRGAVGAAFEIATTRALGIKQAAVGENGADFDIVGRNDKLGKLFGAQGRKSIGDFKVSDSSDNRKSFASKIAKAEGKFINAAGGYIPNFAAGALGEAVAREQAAGLPINQIRINQSGKLRNSQNPMGLAVTNTRDEPTGAIPNFAKGDSSGNKGVEGGALAASTALYFLSSSLGNAESGIGKFISEIAFAASALTSLTLLKGPIEGIGGKLSNFGLNLATFKGKNGGIMNGSQGRLKGFKGSLGRGIAGAGRALPGIGTAVAIGAVVAPLVLELTKTTTGFEKLNEGLKNIDLGDLSAGSKEASAALRSAFIAEVKRSTQEAGLRKELGVKSNKPIGDVIDAQLKGLTGINKGAFGGVRDKETLSASLARVGGTSELQAIIDQSQRNFTVREEQFASANGVISSTGSFKEVKKQEFDPVLFAQNMIAAIERIDSIDKSKADQAVKAEREGKFGEGALTGTTAKNRFQESINQGKFAAGGFDSKDGVVKGARTKILEKELALEKTLSSEVQTRLEKELALDQFAIDAAKERFTITEQYVKSIKDTNVFKEEEYDTILKLVAGGKSLNEIQAALVKAGLKDNVVNQDTFILAQKKLDVKNQELDAQEQVIVNDNKILDFRQEQLDIQKQLNQEIERIEFSATSDKLTGEVSGRKLDQELKAGPVSSERRKEISFLREELSLNAELDSLKASVSKSALNLYTQNLLLQAKVIKATDKSYTTAVLLADADQKRLDKLRPLIEAEKELAKTRRNMSGFDLGMEDLQQRILDFEDSLGKQIPQTFSNNLGQAMQDAVSGAKDLDDALSDAGRNFLGFMRDAFLQQAADEFTSSLFSGGGAGGSDVGGSIGGIFSSIGGLFKGEKKLANANGEPIVGSAESVFKPITGDTAASAVVGGGAGSKGGGISGFLGGLFGGDKKGELGSSALNAMFVQDVGNIKNPEGGVNDAASTILGGGEDGEGGEGVFSKLKESMSGVFDKFTGGLSNLFGGLKESFGGIFKKLTSSLTNLFTSGGGGGGIFSTVLGAFGFASGGPVGFANGGSVGSTDTVPAMLTPGEFVMKKSAVEKYGSGFLSSINEGVMPMRGFQNGGVVGPVSAEAGTGSSIGSTTTNNSDFTFNIQDGGAKQTGGENSADQQRDFAQKVKAAVTTVVQEESRTGGTLSYLYKNK